jgi:leucyl/phenylalanyl-tRNA--protein transferase
MPLTWIEPTDPLPLPDEAPGDEPLAAGRDLGPHRLLEAYRQGIFPWFGPGQPVLWWSPDPRMILPLDAFRTTRSLAKVMRRARRTGQWELRLDSAFDQTMLACSAARAGQPGTWITPAMRAAYGALHRMGVAHSVETWSGDRLVGGLYGVSIGRMFFGESMFARESDASKVALAGLVAVLRQCDFRVIDCQQNTRHLASLGAHEIDRRSFLRQMRALVSMPAPDWSRLRIEVPDA